MKIVFLVTLWKNTQGTGVTRYFINLNNELKKYNDVEISVIYLKGDDPDNYKINSTKYTFPIRAIKVLKKIEPDIIYMDTAWYFLLTGVIFRLFREIKIIPTMHSHPVKLSWFGKIVMCHLLNACNCITYVSKDLRIKIHQTWEIPINVKEEITYAGVQPQLVTESEKNEFINRYNIPKESIILLMQSSPIAKVKSDGTKILFDSINQLKKKYPEIILIITGTGPYLEELKNYALKIGINNHVIFTGWLKNPFIPLSLCNLYVHISLGEGLPLAILEAMSVGKTIIATPVGGIPEIIEHKKSGILVEPDANTISRTINELLLSEELRTNLGNNAYLESKKYTWERCANQFISIFKR